MEQEKLIDKNEKNNLTKKIIIAIEPELKKSFKIKCVENNTEMSKVLKEFINNYINC